MEETEHLLFDILLDFHFKVVRVIVGWQDFSIGAREGWP